MNSPGKLHDLLDSLLLICTLRQKQLRESGINLKPARRSNVVLKWPMTHGLDPYQSRFCRW